ncbi:hypothetical protein [Campylobacter iguaniorum]|uniref:hypothetical protein n=1 Tax=Campylobacter iguaniorum TaxID=1244531 RepID=UPI00073A44EB|nr:hypothetical protein [Campylobacter iguaniorum]
MKFGFGEISNSKENIIIKSEIKQDYDFLLFFDSRGMSINDIDNNNTFLSKFICLLKKKNLSFIAISRPKNLTIFATLLNFIELNSGLRFKNLFTNLGFVDYTPKKQLNINDMLMQINQFHNFDSIIEVKEKYRLIGGGV